MFLLKNRLCATHTCNPQNAKITQIQFIESLFALLNTMLAMALYTHGIGAVAEAECPHFKIAILALILEYIFLISENAAPSHFPQNLSW